MPIIPDVRPSAHITPPRRLVAAYTGPVSGLRAALLSGAATGIRPRLTSGGAQ